MPKHTSELDDIHPIGWSNHTPEPISTFAYDAIDHSLAGVDEEPEDSV